jgi:hypothetical protein
MADSLYVAATVAESLSAAICAIAAADTGDLRALLRFHFAKAAQSDRLVEGRLAGAV